MEVIEILEDSEESGPEECFDDNTLQNMVTEQFGKHSTVRPFVSGKAPFEIHAGLNVEGFGAVGLPVNEKSLDSLRPYFKQAPYGKGYETLVDTNVRNCWELPKDKFQFKNSSWNQSISSLASKEAFNLGVSETVHCIPYKLLLYEEGSFFLPHQDTEKEYGMFATLIIQLPSVYTGGELVMHLPDKAEPIACDLGQKDGKSETELYYAMHYADIKHEIKPLTSGVRMAVTYSVCFTPTVLKRVKRLPSYAEDARQDPLSNILKKMSDKSVVVMPLMHEYTKQSVGWQDWTKKKAIRELQRTGINALKGKDREFVDRLQYVSEQFPEGEGLELILMVHEKTVTAYGEDEYSDADIVDDDEESSFYNLQGQASDFKLDVKIPNNAQYESKVTEREPYSGNEGPTVTTRYMACFLLITRQSKNVISKLKMYGLQKTLADFHKMVVEDPENPAFFEQAKQLEQLLQQRTNWQPEGCKKFAEILLLLKASEMLRKLFLSPLMPHEYWSVCLNAGMLELMDVVNFPEIQEQTKRVIRGTSAVNRITLMRNILPAMFNMESVSEVHKTMYAEWVKLALRKEIPVSVKALSAKAIKRLANSFLTARILGKKFKMSISKYMRAALCCLSMESIPVLLQLLSELKFRPNSLNAAVSLALETVMIRLKEKPLAEDKAHVLFELAVLYNRFDYLDGFMEILRSSAVHPNLYSHLMESIVKHKDSHATSPPVQQLIKLLIEMEKPVLPVTNAYYYLPKEGLTAARRMEFVKNLLPADLQIPSTGELREMYSSWARGALDAALRELLSKSIDRTGPFSSPPDEIRSIVTLLETAELWADVFAMDTSNFINTALSQVKYVDLPLFWQLVSEKRKSLPFTIPLALQSILAIFRENRNDRIHCGSLIFDYALKHNQYACLEEFADILSTSASDSPIFGEMMPLLIKYDINIPAIPAMAKILFVLIHHFRKVVALNPTVPEHCWTMSAARVDPPNSKLEAFLKGNEIQFIERYFRSISEARSFRIQGQNFSVDYQAEGRGAQSYVVITKNRQVFLRYREVSATALRALQHLENIIARVPFFKEREARSSPIKVEVETEPELPTGIPPFDQQPKPGVLRAKRKATTSPDNAPPSKMPKPSSN